jgi:hypothetical protein
MLALGLGAGFISEAPVKIDLQMDRPKRYDRID